MASIEKRGKRYRVRIQLVVNGETIKEQKSFKTKQEADTWARLTEAKILTGEINNKEDPIFSDYFERWYNTFKKPTIAKKTQKNYGFTLKHIQEYFGETTLSEITEESYQQFINFLAFGLDSKGNKVGRERSKETVDKINIHCRSALKKAVKQGLIKFNPAEDIKSVGVVKPLHEEEMALTEDEVKKLIKVLLKDYSPLEINIPKLFVLTALAFGPRFSEQSGLTWDCISFKTNQIKINKTWDFTENDFAPLKNDASARTITVDSTTMSYFRDLKRWQTKKGYYFKNLVFIGESLTPYTNNSINDALRTALDKAKIDKPTISHHNLRHTHITLLLYNHRSLKYVSRRAGHKTVSTTIEKYTHVLDEIEQREDSELAPLLASLYA